uniref:Rld2 n=1 Tax=Arundo donax TaxID=35708 RepID=A0A0A9G996_ARUDO
MYSRSSTSTCSGVYRTYFPESIPGTLSNPPLSLLPPRIATAAAIVPSPMQKPNHTNLVLLFLLVVLCTSTPQLLLLAPRFRLNFQLVKISANEANAAETHRQAPARRRERRRNRRAAHPPTSQPPRA